MTATAEETQTVIVRGEDIEAAMDLEVDVKRLLKTFRKALPALKRLDKSGAFMNSGWAHDLVRLSLKADDERDHTLALVAEGLAELCSYIEYAQAKVDRERNEWGKANADMDLVFCSPLGSPLDVDVVTRRFERRAKDAGVRPIRFHDMRHTHATLLLENGESLKYVAERLGDREDTVLSTYAHVTPKMRAAAVDRLAALIDGTRFPVESATGVATA